MPVNDQMTAEQFRAFMASRKQVNPKNPTKGSKAKAEMELILKLTGVPYVAEHVFSDKRKFRFDWAIPSLKIAIEYEGIMVNKDGKSRHTSIVGYSTDAEKYNLAAIEGWRVFRYTAKNYKKLATDLNEILNHK